MCCYCDNNCDEETPEYIPHHPLISPSWISITIPSTSFRATTITSSNTPSRTELPQPTHSGTGSLLIGNCATAQYTLLDNGPIASYVPFIGCMDIRPECCPFTQAAQQSGARMSSCPQGYSATSKTCCPTSFVLWTALLGDKTPCYSPVGVVTGNSDGSSPTGHFTTGPTVTITDGVFATPYEISQANQKRVIGLSVGLSILGICIGIIYFLFMRRRRRHARGPRMSEIKQGESYDADCPEFVNQYPFDPRLNDSGQQMYTFGEKPIPQAPLAHTWERSHPLIVPPFELPASPVRQPQGQRPRGERRATVSGAPEPRWRKTQYFNTRRRSSSTHVFDRRSSPNDSSATLKDLEPLKSEVRRWSAPAADSTIANNCTGNHFLGTSVLPACPLKTRNSTTQVYDLPNQFWGLWSRPARARLSDARLDFTPPGAARPRNPHVRERPRGPFAAPTVRPCCRRPSRRLGRQPLGGSTLCGDPLGSYVNGSDNDADVSSLASTLGQSLSNSPAARSESSSGLARLAGSYPIRELLTGFGVGFDDSDDTAVEGNAPGDGVVMVEEEEEEEGNGDGVRVIDYWGRCE